MNLKIESLHIYPIKSCAGIDVQALQVTETGPEFDRAWMLVDQAGKFLTQRTHPMMALIKPKIVNSKLEIEIKDQHFQVAKIEGNHDYETVQVWSSEVQAHICKNKDLTEALSDLLKQPVRLAQWGAESNREAKKSGVGLGAQVRFSDKTAFLLATQESLADLNQKLELQVPMSRFRPNVVLSGSRAWAEDQWKLLEVGPLRIEVTQNCGRCPIVNIDQKTGVSPSKEVLQKLTQFRRTENSVDFGVVGVHRSLGELKVGDLVRIQS